MKYRFSSALLVLVGLMSLSPAAVLVNDFSGSVSGYQFTDSAENNTLYNSTAVHVPSSVGLPGQVDVGHFTVNFTDKDPFTLGEWSSVNAYQGALGSFDNVLNYRTGGTFINLNGVTSFLLSLRREALNTAGFINLVILSDQDREYFFPIDLTTLPASMFMDVSVDISSFFILRDPWELGAYSISIAGGSNPSSTYNFSIDSLRAVPEPSSGLLLLSGLGALALLRRRAR